MRKMGIEMNQDTRSYDRFKFIVAVILALIALLLWLRGAQSSGQGEAALIPTATAMTHPAVAASPSPPPAPSPTAIPTVTTVPLPEFPPAEFSWQFDAQRGVLLDPDGVARYRLDEEGKRWVPIIPDDIQSGLPDGAKVAWVDGGWQIVTPDGAALFRWNAATYTWEAIEIAENTVPLPEFPPAEFSWQFDAQRGVLLDPDGVARYRLDEEGKRWVPIIPDDIQSGLPDGAKVAWVDGGWQIVTPDGTALFRWNAATHTWEAIEAAENTENTTETAETGACARVKPPRLTVGGSAKVLTNLNLRRSPGIADNWILTMPAGTVVEVIGGPQCLPYGDGAYRWWEVRLPDGQTGWAAEAPIHGTGYFLEPLK